MAIIEANCIIPLVIGIEDITLKEYLDIALNANVIRRTRHKAIEARVISEYATADGKPIMDIEYQLYDSSIPDLVVIFYDYDRTKKRLYSVPFPGSTVAYSQQRIIDMLKHIVNDLSDFYKEVPDLNIT